MKEKNQQESPEESRERRRIAERDKRRNPKMKMTGKGMKRFAVLKKPRSTG